MLHILSFNGENNDSDITSGDWNVNLKSNVDCLARCFPLRGYLMWSSNTVGEREIVERVT